PSPEAEEWRYSRIDELDLDRWTPVLAAPEHDPGPPPALPEAEGPWAAEITVVDGWVRAVEVRDEAISVETGHAAALGAVLGEAHDSLVEWSIALAPTPVTIRIRRNARVEAPIFVRTIAATLDALSAPRISVVAEEGADAAIVEH